MEYVAPMSFSICYQNGCVACFSQSRYAAKRGWSWIACEPLWWWQKLAGIPYCLGSAARFRGRVTLASIAVRQIAGLCRTLAHGLDEKIRLRFPRPTRFISGAFGTG